MTAVDEAEIGTVIARLARPHASGGYIVGHAAILAEGTDLAAFKEWIRAHGGTLEVPSASAAHGGLHGLARAPQSAHQPRQYLLPPTAFTPRPPLVDGPQTDVDAE